VRVRLVLQYNFKLLTEYRYEALELETQILFVNANVFFYIYLTIEIDNTP
jgi:hypothetical protein